MWNRYFHKEVFFAGDYCEFNFNVEHAKLHTFALISLCKKCQIDKQRQNTNIYLMRPNLKEEASVESPTVAGSVAEDGSQQ